MDEVEASTNRDACVAVAGVTDGLELRVQKYCLPRALGQGVREAAGEAWTVEVRLCHLPASMQAVSCTQHK